MLELLGYVTVAISAVVFGAFAFAGFLAVVDNVFCTLSYCFVKVFIDRKATYNNFRLVWKQTQGLR